MNIETFRSYCLAKKDATEEFPFDESTIVFKVAGKMFALADVDSFESISLKVDPEEGIDLRERYDAVIPAYHMNKRHWVTVKMDGSVPDKLVRLWIDKSYDLVVQGLTRSQKLRLGTI